MKLYNHLKLIFIYITITSIILLNNILLFNQCLADHMSDSFDSQASFNPVGSGARALGLSGAFIAIADDATAASWNPGALIQLTEPEISIVGEFTHWTENNTFAHEEQNNFNSSFAGNNINYVSLVSPTIDIFDRSMLFSINYQHLYMFPREADYELQQTVDGNDVRSSRHFSQKGKLYALGIAGCIQLTKELSVGVTLNFWNNMFGENGWIQKNNKLEFVKSEDFESVFYSTFHNKYSFKGFNLNIGLLWDITDSFILGAVIKTPFKADLTHKIIYKSKTIYNFGETINFNPEPYSLPEELEMPMSSGIGIAYRFSDQLTLSADIHRTEWQNCILTNQKGDKYSFISSKKIQESDIKPTHQFRFGIEYLMINYINHTIIPLRGGIFYDQAPAEGNPDDFFGFSLGTGFSIGSYIYDVAFQYRFGSDVGESKILGQGFSQKIHEYRVYSSFIYHF